uniref:Ig-like domain-containing protein n=1 Tax=Branchiostoma floridae TaxID=7739 RepID=C3YTL0_BRAFL|eukprot:XP_002600125.1 hypothetical protein BRAFLDRAFT_66634 [Branchiostoma floridae]
MAAQNLSFFLIFLLAFAPSQTGPSCPVLCEIKHTGFCPNPGGIMIQTSRFRDKLPCATCNTTGQADENQLGCLPGTLKKLHMVGHSDRNGKLKTLPQLAQVNLLALGPGHILTVERGTLSSTPNLWGLSMSKNAIKTVGSWFGGITKLERLVMSFNEIDEIKENAFEPLVRLEYLELRHNRLRAVEEWHFAGLTNLKYLHLSYNHISHIAGRSFSHLSRLQTLSLDNNKLSSVSTDWLQGLSAKKILLSNNPFRCTCALGRFQSLGSRVYNWDRLQCSYPPSLSGRKIADVPRNEMPCPSPTAKTSRQGTTLVCEVFWEQQPEIRWLDPGGSAVGEREPLGLCGGEVTTRLEHEFPTTQSPERGTAHSTYDPGLLYIGKSISTLHMSQQAYRCWTQGSFRCVVQSAEGKVFANLPLTKSSEESEQDPRQERTAMPAVYTTTPAQRNAKITERIVKSTGKNPQQHDSTPTAGKAQLRTVVTTVSTSKPTHQNGGMTKAMSKTTDKNAQQDGIPPTADQEQWRTWMNIVICIICVILAPLVLDRVVHKCRKCYKKRRPQRDDLRGNADGATGDIPLQNMQPPAAAPATGDPLPPRHTHDDTSDDTPIAPYAETTWLENPMYDADVTRPRGATSIPDRRPRSDRPHNSMASSRPQRPRIARVGKAPDPPPRSDEPVDSSGTYYPPRLRTTEAEDIPDPLPRTNRYVNSNVSSQRQGLGSGLGSMRGQRPSSDRRSLRVDKRKNDEAGPNIYLYLNGPSRHSGSDTSQAQRIPDTLPRTRTYGNSNASSQQRGVGMATMPRHRPSSDPYPRVLRVDEEEDVSGPNIYLDLNGPPRHSGSEMHRAEEIPDPLPRTNRYVNSNVSCRPRGLEMLQAEEIPDPLPRIHTYVNSNISSHPRGAEMLQAEDILDPLPRTNRYVNSNVSSRKRHSRMLEEEEIPDPLPRTNRYVNSNISSQKRHLRMLEEDEIPDPLPRTNRYVNSNVISRPRCSEIPKQVPTSGASWHHQGSYQEEEVEGPNIYIDLNGP